MVAGVAIASWLWPVAAFAQTLDAPPTGQSFTVETVRGGGIKVKLWNKNVALGDLGRWRRMFVELQERGKPGEGDVIRSGSKVRCARSASPTACARRRPWS